MNDIRHRLRTALLAACCLFGAAACGDSASPSKSNSTTQSAPTFTNIASAACEGAAAPADHDAIVEQRLADKGLDDYMGPADDYADEVNQKYGQVEYLSCGGEDPFIRRFESVTARQIWVKEWLTPIGCSGTVVADSDWVVTDIQESATAAALVELGGALQDC